MANRDTRKRSHMTPAQIVAAYLDDRDDELLDAMVTAAALVARADGRVEPVERGLLVDFMDRNGLLSVFARHEILDAFERRVRQLDEHDSADAALAALGRLAGRSPARFVIGAGKQVAAADGHFHPDELHMLQLIRHALGTAPSAAKGGSR